MNWTNLIPWSISLVCMIITIITFAKNGRKDQKAEYAEESQKIESIKESLLKANLKLDQVCATTVETRSDIKAMNEYMNKVEKRVTILEKTMETVWIRIDELKDAVKHE
ncbi:MAG: hypothetical protein IKG39_06025 [Lachnospiraceae bacterium]|nr:hypothetical protein [Lachnospiraceae bacterium]